MRFGLYGFLFVALLAGVVQVASAHNYTVVSESGADWGSKLTNSRAYLGTTVGSETYVRTAGGLPPCGQCAVVGSNGGAKNYTTTTTMSSMVDTRTGGTTQCRNDNGALAAECSAHFLFCDPSTEEYNEANHTCVSKVPVCTEEGHDVGSFTVGTSTSYQCVHTFDTPEEECDDVLGTFNGGVVCGDDRNECDALGGTYGYVDNQKVCLPSEYTDDLPTCTGIENAQLIDGGFVCSSGSEIDPDKDVPDVLVPPPVDTDGDGTPDIDDADLDGDGIPNSTDPDIDGDGVPNEDDLTPNGESEEEPEDNVDGGAECDVSPSCTGNAVDCAMLYQLWKTRCDSDDGATTEEVADDYGAGLLAGMSASAETAGDNLVTSFTDAMGTGESGIQGDGALGASVNSIIPAIGSCSDYSFVWLGNTVSITCASTQPLRDVLYWLVSAITVLALFYIATKSTAQ